MAPPIDVAIDPSHNLFNPLFAAVVLGLLLEGRVSVLHMSPPSERSPGASAAEATVSFGKAQHKAKGAFQVEVPIGSALTSVGTFVDFVAETRAVTVRRGACVDVVTFTIGGTYHGG